MIRANQLIEEYSIQDSTKKFEASWCRKQTKSADELYKYYICLTNTESGKTRIKPAKRFYYGDIPHYELTDKNSLRFTEKGLIVKVTEINDRAGNHNPIHLMQNTEYKEKTIKIPKKKFPK